MAKAEPESIRERKRQLALTLASSRTRLTSRGRDLRRRLSPVHAAGSYFRKHPVQIFGATAAGVAILTFLFRARPRDRKPPKSLVRRSLGWVMSLVKPVVRIWILKEAKTYIQAKHINPETDSLLGP